jgi:hypothetical protein
MEWFVLFYGVQAVGALVLIILGYMYFDKRYKRNEQGSKQQNHAMIKGHLQRTSEVFVDPKDGLKYRVYFDPATGDREYILESD